MDKKSRRLRQIVMVLNSQINNMVNNDNWLSNSQKINDEKIKEIKTTLELINFELSYQQLKNLKTK